MTCSPLPRLFERFAPEEDFSFVFPAGLSRRSRGTEISYNIVVAHVVGGKVSGIAADTTIWVGIPRSRHYHMEWNM